jgi:hypothetical protein
MKNARILSLLLVGFACQPTQKAATEETVAEPTYASYGEAITAAEALDIRTISQLMADKDSLDVKLTGEIEKTCKMKGCWMTVKTSDNSTMRVTFANYGFFVPKEGMEGKTAIMQGKVSKIVNSVETLRHYAQDEGKSAEEIAAITEPQEEYTFVATGVLIEESTKTEAAPEATK